MKKNEEHLKGKFIVLEGSDGSGKSTQSKILADRLKKEGKKVKKIDFPQYENNFFGELVGECLRGDHGDFVSFDPKIASVLYALDRFESGDKIRKWIEDGNIVLADRYASSNQIHQGGKIKDPLERASFLKWLDKLEFKILKIPKPDILVYLNVPVEVSIKLLEDKNLEMKKKYLSGKKDVVEGNIGYMINSKKSAEDLLFKNKKWIKIDCVENGKLLSLEKIHEKIYDAIRKKI